jgi:hypothetical protein
MPFQQIPSLIPLYYGSADPSAVNHSPIKNQAKLENVIEFGSFGMEGNIRRETLERIRARRIQIATSLVLDTSARF